MSKFRNNSFTIYDVMDKKGVFDANPANASSPEHEDFKRRGQTEYPKMLYHPDGETRITVPAEIIVTPLGPKEVGQQRELIHQVASNEIEELELLKAGWHEHPADALKAGEKLAAKAGEKPWRKAPAKGPQQVIDESARTIATLEAENAKLRAAAEELARIKAGTMTPQGGTPLNKSIKA